MGIFEIVGRVFPFNELISKSDNMWSLIGGAVSSTGTISISIFFHKGISDYNYVFVNSRDGNKSEILFRNGLLIDEFKSDPINFIRNCDIYVRSITIMACGSAEINCTVMEDDKE